MKELRSECLARWISYDILSSGEFRLGKFLSEKKLHWGSSWAINRKTGQKGQLWAGKAGWLAPPPLLGGGQLAKLWPGLACVHPFFLPFSFGRGGHLATAWSTTTVFNGASIRHKKKKGLELQLETALRNKDDR